MADADPVRAESRAADVAAAVAGEGVEVLGPVPAWVPRRAGRWRWQIVVRAASEATRAAAMERVPPGVGIDVDPGSLPAPPPIDESAPYNAAMVIRRILTADEPILHEKTKKVTDFDASLHRLLDDLLETMRDAPGIGLAANQVGVPLQVAVIEIEGKITELVNPKVVRRSGKTVDWEGCLSIPGLRGRGRALDEGHGPGPRPEWPRVPGQG